MDLFVIQSPNPNMISVHLVKNGKEISVLFKKNSEGEFFVWEQQEFETPQINGHFATIDETFLNNPSQQFIREQMDNEVKKKFS